MSIRQSTAYAALYQKYFHRRPSTGTLGRIGVAGLLLPCASAWAFVASAHMTFTMLFVGRYDYWFSFAGPIYIDALHERLVFQWAWWYVLALFLAGTCGWDQWMSRAGAGSDRHMLATAVGAAIAVLAFPTWLETLSLLGPAVGALALANIASVLLRGRPLRPPRVRVGNRGH